MDLTPYVAALRDDLAAAAAVGDEATSRAGTSLAAALEPAVRLALMNALSDLAGEVTEALGDRRVSLRLSGREVEVVVDREKPAEEGGNGFFAGPASSPFAGSPSGGPGGQGGPHRSTPPPPPGPGFPGGEGPGFGGGFGGQGFGGRGGPDVGDISRMTLRLVDQIKGQAERAAAAQGMSLNSWIAQAVQGALNQHGRRGGWNRWEGGWGPGGDQGWGAGWGSGEDAGRHDGPGGDRPSSTSEPGSSTDAGTSGTSGTSDAANTADTSGTSSTDRSDDRPDDRHDRGDEGGGVDGWVRG